MQSSPLPRYLVTPRSKYSPQHHDLKNTDLNKIKNKFVAQRDYLDNTSCMKKFLTIILVLQNSYLLIHSLLTEPLKMCCGFQAGNKMLTYR